MSREHRNRSRAGAHATVITLSLSVVGLSAAIAGDLNPPTGPITETGRFGPRIEINAQNTPGDADSLFRIESPGSYYLASNIDTAGAVTTAIEIAAENVSIDLGGFELRSDGTGTAIGVADPSDGGSSFTAAGLAIRNGVISDFETGINAHEIGGLATRSFRRSVYTDLRIHRVAIGMDRVDDSVVRNCIIQAATRGISSTVLTTIENCHISDTADIGIDLSRGILSQCLVETFGGAATGIDAEFSLVTSNLIRSDGSCIRASDSVLIGNTAITIGTQLDDLGGNTLADNNF